jgi:hypothetical protein
MTRPFIVDQRNGCIAVYRGPEVNCLYDLREEDVAFLWNGQKEGNAWTLNPQAVAAARRVCDLLNQTERVEFERDSLHLELDGCQFVRRKDNEYLLNRIARLRVALEHFLVIIPDPEVGGVELEEFERVTTEVRAVLAEDA